MNEARRRVFCFTLRRWRWSLEFAGLFTADMVENSKRKFGDDEENDDDTEGLMGTVVVLAL